MPSLCNARCFEYHKAGKSLSANIGAATINALILFIQEWFNHKKNNIVAFQGVEPIDLCVFEKESNTLFLAEVKSAPLLTLPLVLKPYIDSDDAEKHENQTIGGLIGSKMGMMLPTYSQSGWHTNIYYFDTVFDGSDNYFICSLKNLLKDKNFFSDYLNTWQRAFKAYTTKDKSEYIFWLTNGCGVPSPSTSSWPLRSGSGKESISDGKTSVGLDRTDDIKKGIYQLLKLRLVPTNSNFNVKVGIVSNIHAARHYKDYIEPIKDVMWLQSDMENVTTTGHLPSNTPVHNLFDGIITFTECLTKDTWLKQNFDFQ